MLEVMREIHTCNKYIFIEFWGWKSVHFRNTSEVKLRHLKSLKLTTVSLNKYCANNHIKKSSAYSVLAAKYWQYSASLEAVIIKFSKEGNVYWIHSIL